MLLLSSSVPIAKYSMLLKILPCAVYTNPLTVQAFQSSLFYNSSLITWTVVSFTTAKFDSLWFLTELKQKQKLTAGNQPARSIQVLGPAGTHGHIFVQCQGLCFVLFCFSFRWSSLLTKEGLVFYIYIYTQWCLVTTLTELNSVGRMIQLRSGQHRKLRFQQLFCCCFTQLSHGPRRKHRFPVSPLVRVRNPLPSNGATAEGEGTILVSDVTQFWLDVMFSERSLGRFVVNYTTMTLSGLCSVE
jgi:hypothetical protein